MKTDIDLFKNKAIQNINCKAINIFEVLVECPETSSIVTIEQFLGKRCKKALSSLFTSGYAQNMFKACDMSVVAKSMGFETVSELEEFYYPEANA